MIRRLIVSLVCSSGLLIGLLPSAASAHGPALRGRLVDRSNSSLVAMTGNCACYRQWYTMGLQTGAFKLSITVQSCRGALAPTCGIFAFLYLGSREVQTANVGCNAKTACGQPLQLRYKVGTSGVYYVVIQGTGAPTIWYRMTVRGNIYPLHCHKYC
jgi:hypothetical protein